MRLVVRLAAVLLAAVLVTPAAAQESTEIKDWWAACDNVRVCTAYGFPADEGGGVVLRVRRGAGRNDPPLVDLSLDAETARGVEGALELFVDGKAVARTKIPEGSDDDFRSWDVPDGAKLVAAVANGAKLDARAGARTVASVSLAGASAGLRWMDDRQRRAGGVTALVAKGAATAVPPPPPLPTIRYAASVSQDGLTDTPPPAVLARIKAFDCVADPLDEPTSSRLSRGVVLWAIPCWVGAYQTTWVLVLADEKGGHARLADLGGGGDDPDGRATATSASYDEKQRQLYTYAKGRGPADCGETATYGWTGQGFVLTGRTELSACRGLSQDFWVETFRSR